MKKLAQDRFVKVVEYIDENLDSELDIDKLCQLAHLSKYHFHRQCSVFFGMPVMSLVKLLKLKRAAYRLAYRDNIKVIDIALASGYESHQAFSRAFKKHFYVSPSVFRKRPDWTLWHLNYEPIFSLRNKIMHRSINLKVEVVDFPETPIAVMEYHGSPALIGQTISKFIEWRRRNNLPPSESRTFNLIYDAPNQTPPSNYRFDLCCSIKAEIKSNNYGVTTKRIHAGKCAMSRHIGSDDTIGELVSYLYSQWLPNSDYEARDFPIFFERVSFFPEVSENKMITDVYLPIQC